MAGCSPNDHAKGSLAIEVPSLRAGPSAADGAHMTNRPVKAPHNTTQQEQMCHDIRLEHDLTQTAVATYASNRRRVQGHGVDVNASPHPDLARIDSRSGAVHL